MVKKKNKNPNLFQCLLLFETNCESNPFQILRKHIFFSFLSFKEARKGFFGCYSVCETMKDTKEG